MRHSCLSALVIAASCAASAHADLIGAAVRIQAFSSLGYGEVVIHSTQAQWVNGHWHWQTASAVPIALGEGGAPIATLSRLDLTFFEDPIVNLDFLVAAGPVDTHFIISSALLSFPGIAGAVGNASAAVTVTDSDQQNGATLTGNYPGGRAYLAQYNGFVDGGSPFTTLVTGPVSAPTGGSNVGVGNFPATLIGGVVNDMSSQWDFTVTALDSASGTSSFQIVPAPSSAAGALLGLGLLARRRRR